MKTFQHIALTVAFSFLSFTTAATLRAESGGQNQPYHLSHGDPGDHGHQNDQEPGHFKCKPGDRQSPIGISLTEKEHLHCIDFHYYPTPIKIINNGYTLQINYSHGSSITIHNKKYELLQFHFHHPSEHKIHGMSYDMEAHLVHKGEHGQLAVIAVFMKEGKENSFIKTLWDHFPKEEGKVHTYTDVKINVKDLLPKNVTAYYNYSGSLTTPPYSEVVNWYILKTPIEVSKAEIDKFTSFFKNDARPIQHVLGRVVKENY